ncbi:ABC transporter ATP-binding protein/permease [Liberibacter sp. Z1]|nr:ABC transporter ATP-binding protein/permease [Candidatus Liberibacter sp.]
MFRTTSSILKKLFPYLWPRDRKDLKIRILGAMFFLVTSKLLLLGIPFLYKGATDYLSNKSFLAEEETYLKWGTVLIIAYGMMRIMNLVLVQLRDFLFAKVGQYAVRTLHYQVFSHIYNLSQRFHLEYKVGRLSSAIGSGIRSIEAIVRIIVVYLIPTIFEFLTAMIFLWIFYGYTYVVVVALTIILYSWFTIQASNWRIGIFRKMNDLSHECNAKVLDALVNFETVKYFNSEKFEIKNFEQSITQYERAAIPVLTSLGWLNLGQGIIFSAGMVILMIMSARAIYIGQQTIGDYVFMNALLSQLSRPLDIIGTIYRDARQSFVEIETLLYLLDEKIEIEDKPSAPALKINRSSVTFDNVFFHYNPDRPILKGISFEIPAGKTVALVGKTGSGKSTISRIIYRLYDIQNGSIHIDGQDIRTVTQESLREAIGIVPQDGILFNNTIGYNILYGRPDASNAELDAAVEVSQLKSLIANLPNGYETIVGERGLKLSGGEKQRIAIARTILKNPPILIFDEATSSLDTITEQQIQIALDSLSKNRTTLIIAHRLSTIINADQIIVLHEGKIIEYGSHADLISRNGIYASMWMKQQKNSNK